MITLLAIQRIYLLKSLQVISLAKLRMYQNITELTILSNKTALSKLTVNNLVMQTCPIKQIQSTLDVG